MKKIMKTLIAVFAAATALFTVTGCGKPDVDTTKYIEVDFHGVDGFGTASISGQYDWTKDVIELYKDHIESDYQAVKMEYELQEAVKYSISPDSELSNGDTVTVTADISKKAEEFGFNLTGKELSFTVEGLDEIKVVDPFENLTVVFDGKAPNGKAHIKFDSNEYSASYSLDKENGLSNGDVVKVTASYRYGMEEQEYIKTYGAKFSTTEKLFTVDGLASYAKSVDEIPADLNEKMIKQAEDGIRSYCTGFVDGNSLKELEFIGNYVLSVKDGFSASPNNEFYYVFKMTTDITGVLEGEKNEEERTGEEVFYTYYKYTDVIILPDGTGSVNLESGKRCRENVSTKHGYYSWGNFRTYRVEGYSSLDSMFNDCVTKNIEKYNYIDTVK